MAGSLMMSRCCKLRVYIKYHWGITEYFKRRMVPRNTADDRLQLLFDAVSRFCNIQNTQFRVLGSHSNSSLQAYEYGISTWSIACALFFGAHKHHVTMVPTVW